MFNLLFSRAGLSLERLRTFCEVADAGSMAKAANGDVVRQSQFSRQIKELEEHFGMQFTEKSGRNVVLTSEGRELAALARQVLAGLESFHRRDVTGGGDLVILGAGESFLRGVVVSRLAEVNSRLLNTVLEMRNLRGQETVDALHEGRIDLGVIHEELAGPGLEYMRLGRVTYRLIAWLGENDESACLDWREIMRLPLVALGSKTWIGIAEELLAKAGAKPGVAVRCASWHDVASAVSAIRGVGFMPSILDVPSGCVAVTPPRMKIPEHVLVLAWNSRRGDLRAASAQWRRVLGDVLKF